jgi:DNA-binding NtrC family response regulator
MAEPVESPRILVVDDEKVIREILAEFLTLEGYVVRSVEDGEKALTELRTRPYDLVISDLKMPRVSGLQLLEKITEENINVLTVIMTGFGTVETAIEAMKKGAYDYILKPFKVEEVIHVVQRGLYRQQLQAENIRLREALTIRAPAATRSGSSACTRPTSRCRPGCPRRRSTR